MTTDIGYATYDDVRYVAKKQNFSGAIDRHNEIIEQAIRGQTKWIQKTTKIHWYDSGVTEKVSDHIPTAPITRDDEHSLPTHAGYVDGSYGGDPYRATNTSNTVFSSEQSTDPDPKKQIRLDRGDLDDDTVPAYTRIQLDRKYADAINSLHIANADGGYDDWVASNDYSGGVGFDTHAGDDFYVRINNGGVSELYIDVHSLDDDIAYLSNAVVVDFDHGRNGLPDGIRRAVAKRAWAEIVDPDTQVSIPDDGQLIDAETQSQKLRREARELLNPWTSDPADEMP